MLYVFYDIQQMMMLHQLQLLRQIVDDGNSIITSDLRLSYYSNQKQHQVKHLAEAGLVAMVEHDDDLANFMDRYRDTYSYAGEGVLFLMHLCRCQNCILIIDEAELLVTDIAAYFGVRTMPLKEFFNQRVKDPRYFEFILALQGK
jgi:hypothetical protein